MVRLSKLLFVCSLNVRQRNIAKLSVFVIDVPVTVDNGHSFHRNTLYLSPLRTCRSATVCFHVVRCPLKVIDAKGLACQHRSVVFL